MGSRRTTTVRSARRALLLTAAAGVVIGGGTPWRAHADDAGGSTADCVSGWNSLGTVAAIGEGALFPYENVVGEPYADALIDDTPHSKAKASSAYEGFVGEVLLGTASKLGPDNPTGANAYYPPPAEGGYGGVHDAHDFGPVAHTEAVAAPDHVLADARSAHLDGGPQASVGPSSAHIETKVVSDALSGVNSASAYDLRLGSLHIALATTNLVWKSDGSERGTLANWTMELHGVEVDGKSISASNGDGFSFQGQSPQPGPAAHKQSNDQFKQFTDALQKGGAGRFAVVLQDGLFDVRAGSINIDEVGLKIETIPEASKGGSLRGANIQFARLINHTNVSRGSCDAVKTMPGWTDKTPPAGPNLPPYPPPPSGQSRLAGRQALTALPTAAGLVTPAGPQGARPVA
ncbi:MAG TPA: hypothetical protein VGL20_08030 [Candidatus Dormibacteraeota bacterium]